MKWLVLWSLWLSTLRPPSTRELLTSGGVVRGVLSPCGRYQQFLSIPYATTDRQHRFQDAVPAMWDGIYEAVNEHIKCPQRFGSIYVGQEDCLTLNVYTPVDTYQPKPVMVFIHGGGFREGSSSPFLYGPEFFIDKDVVVVTINYRIEVLGFLCLGIKEAPGNAGLKDQVLALKWVKDNIKVFGGDGDNVTIFGESAGASSVAYHLLSPMSKGLFNKAILQSGTAITPWAFTYEHLETASQLAKQLGYETEDPYEIYRILVDKSAEKLLTTRIPRAEGNIILSETLFVPCVEKYIPGVDNFLPDNPFNLLIKGDFNKVPILLGYNSAEGYLFAGKENSTTIPKIDISKSLPRDLVFPTEKEQAETAREAKNIYLGSDDDPRTKMVRLSKFYGEPFFKYPVIATTEQLLKHNTEAVYSYRFSYDGWLNVPKAFFGFAMEPGATHADDLFYMFKTKLPIPVPIPMIVERQIIDRVTTMWTNFAKFGDPTPSLTPLLPLKWLPIDKKDPKVLVIDKEFSTAPLWDSKSMLFWNNTYTKYRRKG